MPTSTFNLSLLDSIISNLDTLFPLRSPSIKFLDDGCGTGQLTSHLIANHADLIRADARIIATDFSSGMIDEVNKRKSSEADHLWQRLETSVEDAMTLSGFRDGELTHIGSSMCIFLVPSPEAGIAAAYRVLAPGGVFSFSSWAVTGWWDALNSDAVREVKPDFEFKLPIPENMRSEEGVRKTMTDAGFEDVKVETIVTEMQLPENSLSFWRSFVAGTNPGSEDMFGTWSDEEKERVAAAVARDCKEKGVTALKGTAVVVAGRKPGRAFPM